MAFRRIPALFALYKWVPEINGWREALFTGHFGECYHMLAHAREINLLTGPVSSVPSFYAGGIEGYLLTDKSPRWESGRFSFPPSPFLN